MKAMLDIDLDRYYDYFNKSLVSRERIRGFQAGEAVVCLPDGSQVITRLLERESHHSSHTPHVTAALNKFAGGALRGPVELDGQLAAAPPPATAPPTTPTLPEQTAHLWQSAKPEPPLPSLHRLSQPARAVQQARPVKAHLTPELERAVGAWQGGATSVTKLEAALNITHHQAYKLYRQLHELRLV